MLLSSVPFEEKELDMYLELLKATLSVYPEAAFKSVFEEVRVLRINDVGAGDTAGNLQTFTMQVQRMHWSPIQKSREMKNVKVSWNDL